MSAVSAHDTALGRANGRGHQIGLGELDAQVAQPQQAVGVGVAVALVALGELLPLPAGEPAHEAAPHPVGDDLTVGEPGQILQDLVATLVPLEVLVAELAGVEGVAGEVVGFEQRLAHGQLGIASTRPCPRP